MKKLVISVLMIVLTLSATNGMNVIGYGTRASSLGGATQIIDNPHSLIANPAIMGFASKSSLALDLGLMFPSVNFTNNGSDDNVLNDEDGDSKIFTLPTFSYLQKINHSKFAFGLSALAQGGMGATYDLKHELYRNQDGSFIPQKYHSQIAYMKFSPAVSYNFNDNFSIGLAPSIGYAMLEMKMPYSMNPSVLAGEAMPGMTFGQMFAMPQPNGMGYTEVTATADMEDGVTAIGFGGTIGIDYKVNNQFSMGLSYTMQSDLTFEGDAEMDMSSQFNDAFMKAVGNYMTVNPDSSQAVAQGMVMAQFGGMGIDVQDAMANGVIASYDAEVEMSWPQSLDFSMSYSPAKATQSMPM